MLVGKSSTVSVLSDMSDIILVITTVLQAMLHCILAMKWSRKLTHSFLVNNVNSEELTAKASSQSGQNQLAH